MKLRYLCALALLFSFAFLHRSYAQPDPDIWVTAYYAGWMQGWFNNGVLPAEEIDYSSVSHIIHFALWPRPDGTLNTDANSIRETNSAALVSSAHAAGKKVLISIGGWYSRPDFLGATSAVNRSTFVNNLVEFMASRGYDGIDIDWEILEYSDLPQYTAFIKELRARLNQISPRPLLTAAAVWQPQVFAQLSSEFDQINIMTYDMSGAWPGWVVWHNAPTTTNGLRFESTGRLIPSAETMVEDFVNSGVPAHKIGIGIDFYGYIWSGGSGTPTGGVTEPGQRWSSPPRIQVNVPYYSLMQQYYQPEYYRWDSLAQASYLSIDMPGSADDKFVTYDNEWTAVRKVEYARQRGLGGVFIWELGGGRLPDHIPNNDRLLTALRMAWLRDSLTPQLTSAALPVHNTVGANINPRLSWSPADDATFYRLQVATDSAFSSIVVDQQYIIWNWHTLQNLPVGTNYYWRVQPQNVSTQSEWSSTSAFTTIANTALPVSWSYIASTGNSATVRIPASVIPVIGSQPLTTGDAVGVFYRDAGATRCAGYTEWQGGQDLVFTIWEDNPATSERDGLTTSDSLWFQVWDTEKQREYGVTQVAYTNGDNLFRRDSVYTVASLLAFPYIQHATTLAQGENMISSTVKPADSSLVTLLQDILPNMIALRDGRGGVFLPDSGINTIGWWNYRQGYYLTMKSPATLTMLGEEITPEQTTITLTPGWNLIPSLNNIPVPIDNALDDIEGKYLIVKDIAGLVHWPAKGIRQIDEFEPGKAYLLYALQSALFASRRFSSGRTQHSGSPGGKIFPATKPDAAVPLASPHASQLTSPITSNESSEASLATVNTGYSLTLLLETPSLDDGDQVRVNTANMQVGTAFALNGRAIVTVWGDNRYTGAVEGARTGDSLSFTVWSSVRRREEPLLLESFTNALTGGTLASPPRYATDAVWVGRVQSVPQIFTLEQNFPNPFNPTTTIRYTLSQPAKVKLEVFDLLGRRIALVVDREQLAGYHDAVFRNPGLPSGMYFYRIRAEAIPDRFNPATLSSQTVFTQTKKMVIVK